MDSDCTSRANDLENIISVLKGFSTAGERVVVEACGVGLVYVRVIDDALPEPVCRRALVTFDLKTNAVRKPSRIGIPQYSYSRPGWARVVEHLLGESTVEFGDELCPYQANRVVAQRQVTAKDG